MSSPFRLGSHRHAALWRGASPTLTCARRPAHVAPSSDAHVPLSAQAIRLRRAMWMRMHPVERWTSLVDMGRRGAYLIEKAHSSAVDAAPAAPSTPLSTSGGKRLGSSDGKVTFSEAATAAHQQLCTALPYAARLHLCLSLLMWVRCLRDVQDTLARVRLPYAMVRRPQRYAVADVFPTRLSEYWVDVHTTVAAKMNVRLNSTAEQVPAPHTWNVETSETMEDAATESTVTLDAGQVPHGHARHLRLSGRALLQQVQAVQPRASADDAAAARLTEGGRGGGKRHRRHRRLLQESPTDGTLTGGASALSTDTAAATSPQRRETSLEFLPDAARRVAPVSLESQPAEDAAYHGNTHRGEGCPMNDDGESTPTPIHIHVPPCTHGAEAEVLLRHCVMAHAAILSSLYIEGRVVDFSTNNAVVDAYVRWLMEDAIADRYMNATLVDAEAAGYRPYFPPWCWRSVLVLLPPRRPEGLSTRGGKVTGYTISLIKDWAARIVQAAPCAVIVEGGESAAAGYVQRLKDEVERLQHNSGEGTGAAHGSTPRQPVVEWVPIVTSRDTPADVTEKRSESPSRAASAEADNGGAASSTFQPQRTTASTRSSFSIVTTAFRLLSRPTEKKTQRTSHDQRFLHAVLETLQDRFYTCEFLYSPAQSCLTPYRFERWVWEQLPSNVRVVGVNTSPLDVLFYFPQGVFLTQKVGNAFRYRAVERTVVAKDSAPSWLSHPLRHTATQLKRLRRWCWWWQRRQHADIADGLHAELALTDRREVRCRASAASSSSSSSGVASSRSGNTDARAGRAIVADAKEVAARALVRERTVEYLAEPSKWTLLGLATARFFRV